MILQMVTKVMNIREFADFTKSFPVQMERQGILINQELAKSMQRGLRSMAPGRLKQIYVDKKGKEQVELKYPNSEIAKIARFVNNGRYPHHPIPALLMEASRAGYQTAGRKSEDVLGHVSSKELKETGGFVQPRPSPRKGFIDRAWNNTIKRTTKIIEKRLQKAFNDA
jgi:hypothetical protein